MVDYRDRRRYRRARADVRVEFEQYTQAPMHIATSGASSKNVSAAGILVFFEAPLPVSSTVLVRFFLPGEEDPLEAIGRVVRCEKVGGGYDIGLAFMDCTAEEIATIEKYVQSELDEV